MAPLEYLLMYRSSYTERNNMNMSMTYLKLHTIKVKVLLGDKEHMN